LPIHVINLFTNELIDVFSVKGSKHNLIASIHVKSKNKWEYNDDLAD
jgi:adenylate cyclase